jgi:addiction module HigA family antidote
MARTAIHPGEHLAEAIEASGITAAQLACDIEVPPNRITSILHGTRGITANTALRLGRRFDISAAFWMNLQQIYDLRQAEQEIGDGLSRIPTRRWDRGGVAGSRRTTGGGKSVQRAVG